MSAKQLKQRLALEWRSLTFKMKVALGLAPRPKRACYCRCCGEHPRIKNFFPGDREA